MEKKLLENEKFDLVRSEIIELDNSEEAINKKYLQGEVRIITEQARYPLPTLGKMFKSKEYNLHPEFQRRRRWGVIKMSKLIESFIINVPVPPIFLYEIDFANFEVMDGLQRLTTIIDFYDDKFELEGLDEWSELNGKKYSDLPVRIKEGIDRRYLSSVILLNESAKTIEQADRLKKIVFERLNTGGIKLSPQETRNALYDGPLNKLCLELSENLNFRCMWDINQEFEEATDFSEVYSESELFKSMGDVELILRFFAFRFVDKFNGKLDQFLDDFLRKSNTYDPEILNEYKVIFEKNINILYKLFGEYSFKIYKQYRGNFAWRSASRTVYDPLMQVISNYNDRIEEISDGDLDIRVEGLKKFYEQNYNSFDGKRQSRVEILARMELLNNFIAYYFNLVVKL